MDHNIEQRKDNEFIKVYFKSLRIKWILLWGVLCFIRTLITTGKNNVVIDFIILITVSILIYFLTPKYLYKGTKVKVDKFYEDLKNYDKKMNLLMFICNLKKLDGPTFGVLYVSKEEIKFTPFRENLKSESIIIKNNDMKDIDISNEINKFSLFDRVFFKELCKGIKISYKGKNKVFQLAQANYAMEKIDETLK
ncbi:hypothetical protein KQI86_05635 [Clostridium sp. MSJ-11]|uniref:YokE-like PH domain-containing protein n=1 Tax=Clostridium mobile TaxID=2841512 RepID=A0ABS6EH60_9CLOT|nr:hypothetical protein [Clostridium mobile]MBU5483805.1 hypothetical protein [Clostridium mobile]